MLNPWPSHPCLKGSAFDVVLLAPVLWREIELLSNARGRDGELSTCRVSSSTAASYYMDLLDLLDLMPN